MDGVTLRKLPGGLVLGLLASLAAHTALYGGQHAQGGVYHDMLMQITSAAALGFLALALVLAWNQAAHTIDGSVLAARLRERLPDLFTVVGSTAVWYAAIEAVEPRHAGVPWFAVLIALVVAAFAVLRLGHAVADAVARIAISVFRICFSSLAPTWDRRPHDAPIARQRFLAHRRFARPPPPIVLAFSRA